MTHDDIAELLGAYALDALDGDERDLVERHLAECPRCRAEVQEHRETAAYLAHGGGAAPEGVWSRIADALEEAPPRLRLAPVGAGGQVGAPRRRRPPPRLAMAVLGAAAALVIAVLGIQVLRQDQRIDELRVAAQDPLDAAVDAPGSRPIELASSDGAVVLRGAVAPDGTGYLAAGDLPALAGGRTYQLWGAAGDTLISLGVLGPDPDVVAFRGDAYEAFAITAEDAPGVIASSAAPVVVGAVAT